MKSLLPFALAAGLCSCETLPDRSDVKSAPDFSRLGLRKSGQVYHGKMSWYSVRTNGGTATASGERFTNSGNTAAHKTLPMGTLVEVTNLNNNRSAIVRINDRGPFTPGRIIDVSIGVAGKLDFVNSGVVPCRVEVLQPVGRR
ncbi:MAG: septal ring lytic transglycosylase RlpA family protein [Verrucomicrobiales bacterium]|nr:septal ring lytic transglycosylase RlpA family protein [Verrucomicrobiales bacterium]